MIDISKPVTNPALAQALEQLHQENTPANQDRVLDEIVMRAHFLAPVVISPAPSGENGGETVMKQGTTIQFQLISTQNGRPFFPAFTDWPQLRRLCGPRDQQTMVLTFDDYASMLAGDGGAAGFVVNPFGAPLTLERDFVADLAKQKKDRAGYSRQVIQKDTKVLLGDPADYPQAMADAICLAVRELPEVKALYLRLMSRQDESQSNYLVVVDHCGEQDRVFRTIADAARPHLEGRFVDMVPFDSDFGRTAAKDVKPFFSRN